MHSIIKQDIPHFFFLFFHSKEQNNSINFVSLKYLKFLKWNISFRGLSGFQKIKLCEYKKLFDDLLNNDNLLFIYLHNFIYVYLNFFKLIKLTNLNYNLLILFYKINQPYFNLCLK